MNHVLSVLLNLWAPGWACSGLDWKSCSVGHQFVGNLYLLSPRKNVFAQVTGHLNQLPHRGICSVLSVLGIK